MQKNSTKYEDKWWYRLCKVLYGIMSGVILIPTLGYFLFSDDNAPFNEYGYQDYGDWLFTILITLLIYWAVFKGVKVGFFYIVFGEKLSYWNEFSSPFKKLRDLFFERVKE